MVSSQQAELDDDVDAFSRGREGASVNALLRLAFIIVAVGLVSKVEVKFISSSTGSCTFQRICCRTRAFPLLELVNG